ncbi:hypothetical protein CIT26_21215 [Mesorhizobium temperatum]|uniref:Uncharacterized protein n=1 Tax=Mesorhizobium temperatum TaxID=241416 RepID=A0A271LHG8_9HYPH|nr:hypothetical protein CIT26_21215 [Mesorhizobium temperatum]
MCGLLLTIQRMTQKIGINLRYAALRFGKNHAPNERHSGPFCVQETRGAAIGTRGAAMAV